MGKKGKGKPNSKKNDNEDQRFSSQNLSQTKSISEPTQSIQSYASTSTVQAVVTKDKHQTHHQQNKHHKHNKHHSHRDGKSDREDSFTRFTWQEVSKHDHRDDLWVVIDEGVYNLSKMVEKHPGGAKVIVLRAGKKADKAFVSGNHPPKVIDKILPHFRVGSINEQSQIESWQRERKTGKADAFIVLLLSILIFGFMGSMVIE